MRRSITHDTPMTLSTATQSLVVVLEQAGHMPFVEQPAAFLAAVRRWLTEQGVIGEPAAAPQGSSEAGTGT